ncbi:MAG TPA: hypothetical protein PKZ53_07970 [Acidobacteriota bacterium]|nr:hypothetical protein [Acidobacteriota bacterium]HNH81328.1 hypothetical protein [Acidobacteriota bacterium]HNJ40411.1 hypothetical protein [Acidobacteriota bacterium]
MTQRTSASVVFVYNTTGRPLPPASLRFLSLPPNNLLLVADQAAIPGNVWVPKLSR